MFFQGGGDPFAQHFHHGGGRRGGGGSRSAPSNVDTNKLYETLGVPKTATSKEIKTAYRKLAVQHHPDKGGEEHRFKEINAAYQVLMDPEKRAKYDKFGLEGLDESGGGGGGGMPEDLFSMFFGGGASGNRRSTPRGDDVNHVMRCSLEDLYNGKTAKMAVTRQVLDGEPRMCTTCDGEGIVVELRRIGLGMVQQIQRHCQDCDGEGYRCRRKSERKVVEVLIEKGMRHQQKIVFRGMADEKPNMEAGDVNFMIQELPHATFKRKGADLLIAKTISLKEALTGFAWKVKHLDGRSISIQSTPGEVIPPESAGGNPFVKIVPNEGMPCQGNPFVKGNLYVLFTVEFPKDGDIPPEAIEILRQYLPGPSTMELDDDKKDDDDDEAEVVHLAHADVKSFGKGGLSTADSAYDSDDDDDGPRGVNCQQS